ncbi:MAG: HEAT repeat domain-containing protein, partial [Planctomycetes bacterium]|nr:HEAT repeat domain-containing protein [Planctomycetota bacterium]
RSAVINGAHSGDQEVRIAALGALQKLGNSSDVTLLAHIASTTDGLERDAARSALNRLRGTDIDETILKAAQEQPDVPLRCELIRSLAGRWYRPAIPALLAASKDSAEDVQIAAFEALGSLGRPEHLPKLVARLAEELGDGPREAAEDAVVDTAARIADAEQRVDAVLAALVNTSGSVKASMIRVLGRIGGGRALEAIRGQWRGFDPDVADAAVRALANWPTAEVTGELLEIARGSTDETHPVLALRGYVRLIRLPSDRTPAETFKMLEQAMSLTSRPEEKKLVLGGLADVRHMDALMMADMCLGDQALRDEAGITMLAIARALAAEQRDAAVAAIEKVSDTAASDAVRQQAAEAAEFLDRFAGYSATWVVAGPYMREGHDLAKVFEIIFPPETPDAPDVEWKPLGINNRDNPWIFQLDQAIGGSNCCVYVKTEVWSDSRQTVRLEIGSDDAVKAWVNGNLVHSNLVHRGVAPAQDKLAVTLREGWSQLMLKVVQGGGAWGFCAGFTTPDGGAVEGLRFRAE